MSTTSWVLWALALGICVAGLIIGLWFWSVSRYQAHREADAQANLRRYLKTRSQTTVTPPPPREYPPRRGDHP